MILVVGVLASSSGGKLGVVQGRRVGAGLTVPPQVFDGVYAHLADGWSD